MLCDMAKPSVLGRDFFERETLTVARELLGKYLVYGETALMITEVEAYDGPHDLASHAARGKTARNGVMFGEAGVWYIYLCYGVYWLLNIVTGAHDYPAAILIRGVEGVQGPGRVTRHFGIDASLNRKPAEKANGLWLEDRGVVIDPRTILKTTRIGVSYAGPIWANKKYRLILESLQNEKPGVRPKERSGESARSRYRRSRNQ
jgi:DNA-3-methyladenine glycosylase